MLSRQEQIEEAIQTRAVEYLTRIMKYSITVAADYCKETGRTIVTPLDMEYALKFCAMYSHDIDMSEVDNIEDEDSDEGWETDEEGEFVEESEMGFEDEFRKYEGTDEYYLNINEAFQKWREWEPEYELDIALKNAINRM